MILIKTRNIADLNRFNEEVKIEFPTVQAVLKFGESSLKFNMTSNMSAEDEALLDSFIVNFIDSNPEDKVPLIMDIVKSEFKNKPFHGIKYTGTQELQTHLIGERAKGTVKGEVQEVFWYKDMNFTNPASPFPETKVLRTNVTYTRDATGFAMFRDTTRTYYNRDGSENENVKHSRKYYFVNKQDMIDEGVKRRSLLVKTIQIPTMELIAEVLLPLGVTMENVVLKGRQFMDDYQVDFNNFINNSSTISDPIDVDFGMKTVIVKLRDEDNLNHVEWLDKIPNSLGGSTSIRNHLISEFSI